MNDFIFTIPILNDSPCFSTKWKVCRKRKKTLIWKIRHYKRPVKKYSKERHCFKYVKILMSGLIGNSYHICFYIQVSVICCFLLKYKKKIQLKEIYGWRMEEYFNNLFRCNCGCSLILHPNSTSGRFLKLSCDVISKHLK